MLLHLVLWGGGLLPPAGAMLVQFALTYLFSCNSYAGTLYNRNRGLWSECWCKPVFLTFNQIHRGFTGNSDA